MQRLGFDGRRLILRASVYGRGLLFCLLTRPPKCHLHPRRRLRVRAGARPAGVGEAYSLLTGQPPVSCGSLLRPGFPGSANVRFWPLADPNFTLYSLI